MTQENRERLSNWRKTLSSSLTRLHQLKDSTEREFLRIGSALQDIYAQAVNLGQTAAELVHSASGEEIVSLVDRLREIVEAMSSYLEAANKSESAGSDTLRSIAAQLKQIQEPLKDFKRMSKNLFMLEVAIKIESAHMGSRGDEFVNLALDIKDLSHQIKEKALVIGDHHQRLAELFASDTFQHDGTEASQDRELQDAVTGITDSLAELEAANAGFAGLGAEVRRISEENSAAVSNVVQSLQVHDKFRQQLEHIIAALAGVAEVGSIGPVDPAEGDMRRLADVCELQEAQLRAADSEFCRTVTSLLADLDSIGARQQRLSEEIFRQTGSSTGRDRSFLARVNHQVTRSIDMLEQCAGRNSEVASTMAEVAGTVEKMTALAAAIEEIGNDIIIISLNARIKATGSGSVGNAMSALAEEISQLSGDAVDRTEQIISPLHTIHTATDGLAAEVNHLETTLHEKLVDLQHQTSSVFDALEEINGRLGKQLTSVQQQVEPLDRAIAAVRRQTTVHEQTAQDIGVILATLRQVVDEARTLFPADADITEHLRRISETYTMESERLVHESIAAGGRDTPGHQEPAPEAASEAATEFGDNVELF